MKLLSKYLILLFTTFWIISAQAAFTSSDFLKANGTVLRNQSGRGSIINLHGTNLGGWLLRENWMSPSGADDEYSLRQTLISRFNLVGMQSLLNAYTGFWLQAGDLDKMKQLGINVLRVPMYWEDFMNSDGSMKPDAITFTHLDWLAKLANARNIYLILDLHGTPGADCPWQSCGRGNYNQLWSSPTYQDWTAQIWQRLATHFKGNPVIAAYDLMNEPLVTMGNSENPQQVQQKMALFNRLYQTVRTVDPDHIIIIAAFFDYWAAVPPSTYGWTNIVYQTHHYQFTNFDDWNLTNKAIDGWLQDLANYQYSWNIPIYAGEYAIGQNDLYEKWLNGLNALNASWTNWSYKVVGNGNWGFYNNNNAPYPNIKQDTSATMIAKWAKFTTQHFQTNSGLIALVKKYIAATPVATIWSSLTAGANGKFVTADNGGSGPLTANRNSVGTWERFKVIKNSDGTISLWSMSNNKYVQANVNNSGQLVVVSSFIGTWEKFIPVNIGNGNIALKSLANNKFVTADLGNNAVLYANRDQAGGWETFTIANA